MAFWVLVATLFLSDRGLAADIEGITFADRFQAGPIPFRLKGVGLARYLYAIKVYVAALYVDDREAGPNLLADVPKRLEIHYFQKIAKADFAKAAERVLLRNVEAPAIASVRSQIDRLQALYQDIGPGDRYALTYIPGVGTELALNGERKGVVEGAEFAAAYFAIWLGADPINEGLKKGLMGER